MMHADQPLTITIPMQLRRRSGRKLVVVPDDLPAAVTKPSRDDVLVRAIVKAHRWRRRTSPARQNQSPILPLRRACVTPGSGAC